MSLIPIISETLATRYGSVDWDVVYEIDQVIDDVLTGEVKPDEVINFNFLTTLDNNAPDEDLQNEFFEVAANIGPLGASASQIAQFKDALYKLPVVNKGRSMETYHDIVETLRNMQNV